MKKRNLDPATTLYPFLAIFVLCLFFVLDPAGSTDALSAIRGFLGNELGLYYLLIGLGVLLVSLWAAFSPIGNITLGKPGEKPKYDFFSWGAGALKLCRMLFSSVGFCFHTGDTVQVSSAGYVLITGFKRSSVSTVIWTGNTGNQALLCILHIRSGRCSGSSQAGSILLCLCDLACRSSCLTKFFNSLLGSCSAGFHCHDGAAVCEPDSALITAILLLAFCTDIRIVDFCAEPLLCLLNSGTFTARFRSEPSCFGPCSANLTCRSACGFHRNNFTFSKGRAVFHSRDSLAVGGTDERLILLPERTAILSGKLRQHKVFHQLPTESQLPAVLSEPQ